MTNLVVGATGATGRLLVEQLLKRDQSVKAIVRSAGRLPEQIRKHDRLTIAEASILDLSDSDLATHVAGCDAVASCLGHNLSFKGMYGHPRLLVTDATRRLCNAIRKTGTQRPTKFVLMNTDGNRNRDLNEHVSFGHRCVVGLIRLLVPPHRDNERAADYLRTAIGQNDTTIEWCAVRPSNLTNEVAVTDYELHASPTRDAIFNPGKTSRVNVADFMSRLITDDEVWKRWRGKMPVIYNVTSVREPTAGS